jgi:S-adenosylmethionine synthetase
MGEPTISVQQVDKDPIQKSKTEIVERKGLGHPETICDNMAEEVSKALCREYRERFGRILHHNTDEVQLVAGEARPEFGEENKLEEKIYILLAGRATKEFEGEEIPVDDIAIEAAKKFISDNFKILRPEHLEFESRIGETSTDLEDVYNREETLSNDTSFGVGHYPLSSAEKLALGLEEEILRIDEAGEDIKILVEREEDIVDVTVAVAGIARKIKDLEAYREFKSKIKEKAKNQCQEYFPNGSVHVNIADSEDSVYLTETGTSAENGDDGSVGRGNRYNGVITPGRSMSLEAWAGKNPVTHPGKINQIRAHELSKKIHKETGKFAQCKIINKIGRPIQQPVIHIKSKASKREIKQIVEEYKLE